MRIPSGAIDQKIHFVAVNSIDTSQVNTGVTSFTVYRDRNGNGSTVMTSPTISEVDSTNMPGVYTLLIDEDTIIDAGNDEEEMILYITADNMVPFMRIIEIFRPKITQGYTLGVAADGDLLEVNSLTGYSVSDIADAVVNSVLTDVAAGELSTGQIITLGIALRATFNRFFRSVSQTASSQVIKNDSNTTIASMALSETVTTQTKGTA